MDDGCRHKIGDYLTRSADLGGMIGKMIEKRYWLMADGRPEVSWKYTEAILFCRMQRMCSGCTKFLQEGG